MEARNRSNWAMDLALAMLSPFFFLSLFLGILAPLPLLYLHQGRPERSRARLMAFIATIFGLALCFWVRGQTGLFGFLLYAALPALVAGELLEQWKKPGLAILGAFFSVFAASLAVAAFLAQQKGQALPQYLQEFLLETIRSGGAKLLENPQDLPASLKEEDLKAIIENPSIIIEEMPGYYMAALFFLCALPIIAIIRWNPKGFSRRLDIRRDYLRQWKSPDWLVWPALACGALLIFEVKTLSSFANNLLKPILVIYFFQGLSIMSYFLDIMRLKGPIRAILYGLGIIFLTPMLISFGFFDLWFNFRTRVRREQE